MKNLYKRSIVLCLIIIFIVNLIPVNVNAATYISNSYYSCCDNLSMTKEDFRKADIIQKNLINGKDQTLSGSRYKYVFAAFEYKYFYFTMNDLPSFVTVKKNKIIIKSGKKFEKAYNKAVKANAKFQDNIEIVNNYENKIIAEITKTPYKSQRELYNRYDAWLIKHTNYDYTYSHDVSAYWKEQHPGAGTALNFAKYNDGVCADFSQLTYDIFTRLNIKVYVVGGDTPYGEHAWNKITLDGKTYEIDETWNVSNKAQNWGPDCNRTTFSNYHKNGIVEKNSLKIDELI